MARARLQDEGGGVRQGEGSVRDGCRPEARDQGVDDAARPQLGTAQGGEAKRAHG